MVQAFANMISQQQLQNQQVFQDLMQAGENGVRVGGTSPKES